MTSQIRSIYAHAGHLELVPVGVAIQVLVENRKRLVRLLPGREEPRDVADLQAVGAGTEEGVEQTPGEQPRLVRGLECGLHHRLRRVRLEDGPADMISADVHGGYEAHARTFQRSRRLQYRGLWS